MNTSKISGMISKVGVYAGTFLNSAIVLVTVAVQQITTAAVYYCPCIVPNNLTDCDVIDNSKCNPRYLNFSYGLAFIVAPAIGLFVFGFATSTRLWKTLTGCTKKTKSMRRDAGQVCCTLVDIVARGMIAPFAWVSVAFLDGRYFACAVTPYPYEVGPLPAAFLDCAAVARAKVLYHSYAFNENRSLSQLIGWITICVLVVAGLIAFGTLKCTSPLTYYQAKFYTDYMTAEEAALDQEMKTKAIDDAEAHVKLFMEKPRSKSLWDRISTVYEFHRDKKNVALYSNLHKWVLEEKDKSLEESKPLISSKEAEDKEKPKEPTVSV